MSQVSSFYGYPQSTAVQSATSSYNNPSQKVLREGYKLVYSSGSSHHYQAVEKAFKNFIETLYGDQTSLLKQLEPAQQKDSGYTPSYNCEVLLKDENPVGFVVYKNKLTSTHAEDKECNSLELRHLQLINPNRDSGAGYRTLLLNRVKEIAGEHFAGRIHCCVATKDDLRSYLRDNDFQVNRALQFETANRNPSDLLYLNVTKREEPSRKRGRDEFGPNSDDNNQGRNEGANKRPRLAIERGQALSNATSVSGQLNPQRPIKTHEVTLRAQYIRQIRSGEKTIEGRLNKGMFKSWREGDRVRFFYQQNLQDDIICEIVKITNYKSFPEMLANEGFKACLPESPSIQHASNEYDRIPNYTVWSQQHGVLAIKVKIVNN